MIMVIDNNDVRFMVFLPSIAGERKAVYLAKGLFRRLCKQQSCFTEHFVMTMLPVSLTFQPGIDGYMRFVFARDLNCSQLKDMKEGVKRAFQLILGRKI